MTPGSWLRRRCEQITPLHLLVDLHCDLSGLPLRAAEALSALADLRTLSYPVIELADGVWTLCESLTAYDAAYLALAQRLDVGLITLDAGLAKAAAADGRLLALTN